MSIFVEKDNSPIITIVISAPPFSHINAKEGVDLALVCAAFDYCINLIFIDQGVLHLVEGQDEIGFANKYHDKQIKALPFYGIERVFAETQSLTNYCLTEDSLIDSVKLINREQFNQLCTESQQVVTF